MTFWLQGESWRFEKKADTSLKNSGKQQGNDKRPVILIIDDEPDNLEAIENLLSESDTPYRLRKSPNGRIALKKIADSVPDLVITDWDMPEMNGIEFIRQLKSEESTTDIPVIMCTGVMTTSENLQTALEAGALDYIRKPVDRIELLARTRSMLQLGSSIRTIKDQHKALQESYKNIERMAGMDSLTQLSNRRELLEKIKHEKARADRNTRSFVLALGDIDKFKTFNDRYGHDCGDHVLVSVASALKEMVRNQDSVGRWGGEEFLMLFPETDLEGGRIIAEKIRAEIADRTYGFQEQSLKISITIGLSLYEPHACINDCLKRADAALYRGKEAGRNRVVVHEKD